MKLRLRTCMRTGRVMMELANKSADLHDELVRIRKDLHRFPELGFKEYRTAEKIAAYLKELGLEVRTGIGGTGVVALLRGLQSGPTVGIRACLDALAMDECSGVEYASENRGVFHGCGHDGNMTIVLGAAKILSMMREKIKGNIKLIFQPSEEETGGAIALIQAGSLHHPEVDAIVHIHNWPGLREGIIGVKAGPVLASSDVFRLDILGRPGHGAWPHLAVDPIVTAANVISTVQSIISREMDPTRPALITIGKIQGGTAVNVIPDKVTLEGTVRAYHQDARDFIARRFKELVQGVTQAARAGYELKYDRIMPPVCNDPALSAKISTILTAGLGPARVTDEIPCEMGCEEFALFQQEIPGVFLFLGSDREGKPVVPLHDPAYVFNDSILAPGVEALCRIVLEFQVP